MKKEKLVNSHKERFQLRDLFTKKAVIDLGGRIKKVYPIFYEKKFISEINTSLEDLGFGERNKLIQDILIKYLPNEFEKVVEILISSLSNKIEANTLEGYEGFIIIPETYVIERLGMNHFELSMEVLYEMTMRCSSEGAIRRFIEKYPEESLKLLKSWTKDENVHVRRLVSEGSRSRLPLESPIRMFISDPRPVINLLNELKDDSQLYVRRSVANNLNDISKDNPQIVIDTLKKWKVNASKERLWIINHSLRTLFKQGNFQALELLGFKKSDISIINFNIKTKIVNLGDIFEFEFEIKSYKDQKLMIDYNIYFMKSNGKALAKTFKISKKNLKKNEIIKIRKKHPLIKMTTRKLYSGKHYLELQINGEKSNKTEFEFINK